MKKRAIRKRILVFGKKLFPGLILAMMVAVSCGKQTQPDQTVIARVGDESIRFRELETSLYLEPQYTVRSPLSKVRQSQLNYLIQQRFDYLAARKVKLEREADIRPRLEFIRSREIFKAFIRRRFLDQVQIDRRELAAGLERFAKKLDVQNLYFPDSLTAVRYYRRLRAGESFEDLAAEIYQDPRLKQSGGDLGYITFGDLDPGLEEAAYSLKKGEISTPVKSVYGYHILRVRDVVNNPAMDYLQEKTITRQVSDILKQRKVDRRIRAYLKELAGEHQIEVNNRALSVLTRAINEVMGAKYENNDLFKPPINNGELRHVQTRVSDILDQPLVRFGDREIRVKRFLNRIRQTPPLQRPYLKTRSRILQFIINSIREDLLIAAARQQGIDREPAVRRQIDAAIRQYLAEEFNRRLSSPDFRATSPAKWRQYQAALAAAQRENKVTVFRKALFYDVKNPEKIYVDPAIPVMLKNKYMW